MSDRVVAVIIPFFQREKGILLRALNSVVGQKLPAGTMVRILVIDDSSPVSSASEINGLALPDNFNLELVEQPNSGPGGARNRGLDMLNPDETTFVAFLDSDDVWTDDHLALAIAGLGSECDFFFSDHTRFNIDITWFEDLETTRDWKRNPDTYMTVVSGQNQIYRIDTDLLFTGLLNEYLSQTSTIVFRFSRHSQLRFDIEQRSAGEDHLFWLCLAKNSRASVICMKENVFCGRGVNIYYEALEWTSAKVADRYGYLVLFLVKAKEQFELSRQQNAIIDRRLQRYTRAYGYLFIRFLTKRQFPSLPLAQKIFARDPLRIVLIPYYFLSVLPNRAAEAKTW
ncbi:glycosyltransferase family A protein [Pararhizobium sp. IMCC21322]|uniref:glycosyltransferase family A protein n=1 Tax=Pararhizobium sp. IMCC21322 TaxID=3067903 RepID=UPI0027406E99|nr:glycosyltransferase family 2 protein [Pararhizobium sp. IMCC21322]